MKNQFWAVGWGLGWTAKNKVWANYEQLLKLIFLKFSWVKNQFRFVWILLGISKNLMKNLRSSEPVGQEEIVSSSLETLFRNLNSTRCASSFKSHPPPTTSRLVWPQFLSLNFNVAYNCHTSVWSVTIMCHNDELSLTMSWVWQWVELVLC